MDVSLILFPATDLAAAKQFFRELLGVDPYVDSPQYVGYKAGGAMEIGLTPNAGGHDPAGVAYWDVSDIAASLTALVTAGGSVEQNVTDVGYGLLVAKIKAPNGASIGLRQKPAA